MRNLTRSWPGWAALGVALGAVWSSLVATSTHAGQGIMLGFGAFMVFFAMMALLVQERTSAYWGLVVVGLMAVMVPWLAEGFVTDTGAAWTGWIAGALALTLGAIGWVTGRPPTVYGINGYGTRGGPRGRVAPWITRAALGLGLVTAVVGATVLPSSPAVVVVTVGAGFLMAVIALWAMLAADPTHDYFTLAVVGFALVLAPSVVGFTGDAAALAAWGSGLLATTLGMTGYLRGHSLNVSGTVRAEAIARYREQFWCEASA